MEDPYKTAQNAGSNVLKISLGLYYYAKMFMANFIYMLKKQIACI